MKIVCEFNNLTELENFAKLISTSSMKSLKKEVQKATGIELPREEVKESETVSQEKKAAAEPEEDASSYTLVDVRAKLAELQKSGKRDQVKELLESFGAGKLSDVSEERYAELMEKAGEL